MNIHTYEKLWLVAGMVLIVAFIATVTYGAVGLGIAMVDDSEPTIDPNNLDEHEGFADPGVTQVDEDEYEVYVEAWQFGFTPGSEHLGEDPIVIPEGSTVTFYVTSSDVIHSFSVVGTNVNTMVVPGEIATMTVEFDETGEYGVLCNEYCGGGHHDMEGMLYVVPEDEFTVFDLAVGAPEDVDEGESAEITADVTNELLEERTTTVELTVGEEVFEEEITVPAESTESVSFTVDAEVLEAEGGDWTVVVEDLEEDGEIVVGADEADDEETDEADDEETDDDEEEEETDDDGEDEETDDNEEDDGGDA